MVTQTTFVRVACLHGSICSWPKMWDYVVRRSIYTYCQSFSFFFLICDWWEIKRKTLSLAKSFHRSRVKVKTLIELVFTVYRRTRISLNEVKFVDRLTIGCCPLLSNATVVSYINRTVHNVVSRRWQQDLVSSSCVVVFISHSWFFSRIEFSHLNSMGRGILSHSHLIQHKGNNLRYFSPIYAIKIGCSQSAHKQLSLPAVWSQRNKFNAHETLFYFMQKTEPYKSNITYLQWW